MTTDLYEALLKVIDKGETKQLEKDMLLIGGNANCSPLESKAKGRSSTGSQPSFGLFLMCFSVAILALLYNMICVFSS